MNGQLIAAGFLAVLAAAIHGGAGEVLVVRRLSPETLAGTAFGPVGEGHLRLSYANSLENLSLAVERIRDWVRSGQTAAIPTGR